MTSSYAVRQKVEITSNNVGIYLRLAMGGTRKVDIHCGTVGRAVGFRPGSNPTSGSFLYIELLLKKLESPNSKSLPCPSCNVS